MTALVLICIFSGLAAAAKPLLLPANNISARDYFDHCSGVEYRCTTELFFNKIGHTPTPQFNRLLSKLDRSSTTFRREFRSQVTKLLQTEMLDMTQLYILLKLLREFPETRHLPITLQLMQIQSALHQGSKESVEDDVDGFAILFKKKISLSLSAALRKKKLPIVVYFIKHHQFPLRDSLDSSSERQKFIPLLASSCPDIRENFLWEEKRVYIRKKCTSATSPTQHDDARERLHHIKGRF